MEMSNNTKVEVVKKMGALYKGLLAMIDDGSFASKPSVEMEEKRTQWRVDIEGVMQDVPSEVETGLLTEYGLIPIDLLYLFNELILSRGCKTDVVNQLFDVGQVFLEATE